MVALSNCFVTESYGALSYQIPLNWMRSSGERLLNMIFIIAMRVGSAVAQW